MKNLYALARSRMLRGLINVHDVTNKLSYVFLKDSSTYVPNFNDDEFLDIITAGDILHGPVACVNPDGTNFGTAVEVDDLSVVAFPAGTIGAIVVVVDTGSPATSPLVGYTNEDLAGNPIAAVMNGTDDLSVVTNPAATKLFMI